jgi:hypothetical protein
MEVVEYRSDGSSPMREHFQHGLRSDWQMTDARARGGKDRIPNRGCNRCSPRLAKPNGRFRAGEKLDLDFGCVSHPQHAIGVKVGIFRLAVHELRSLVQRNTQSPQRAASTWAFGAIRVNDCAGVNHHRQLLCGYAAGLAVDMHASGAGCPGGHTAFLAERRRNPEPEPDSTVELPHRRRGQ